MRIVPALFLVAALLAGCNSAPTVDVDDAMVKLPPIAGRPGVAYFSLHANKLPMRLTGVSSPKVGRIELHESSQSKGVMRMGVLKDTSFTGDGDMEFEAGGKHAMLFDIDPSVRAGGKIPLVFDFDNAPDVTVLAKVETIGAD